MKPTTTNMEERCNKLFKYLRNKRDYATKEEIGQLLDLSNERSIRDVIGTLAKKYPIISTSDRKGYKLGVGIKDLEEVEHMWKEIDHRIAELEARKKPLIKFYELAKEKMRNESTRVN